MIAPPFTPHTVRPGRAAASAAARGRTLTPEGRPCTIRKSA